MPGSQPCQDVESPFVAIFSDKQFLCGARGCCFQRKRRRFRFTASTSQPRLLYQRGPDRRPSCFVEVDRGEMGLAGNYTSGSLSVLPVKPGGGVGAHSNDTTRGLGAESRKEKPHVHCTLMSADKLVSFCN